MSEITRDVLRQGVLTKPAFDLLCETHIDRHKHRLREVSVSPSLRGVVVRERYDMLQDVMLKRVDELRTYIGLS